jgi:hypothetical protein
MKLYLFTVLLLVLTTQVFSKSIYGKGHKKHRSDKCLNKGYTNTGIKDNGEGLYSISVGEIKMTIDAAHGAKILSFKYGDEEILNQGDAPNSFGSTFWTSPQKEWNWPPVEEYDTKEFTAKIDGNKLLMDGQTSQFGYSIHKQFTADKKRKAIEIKYSIVNESDETRKVAPWEISRVPNDGMIFFESDAVEAANNMTALPFEFKYGGAWYVMDESEEFRKINSDGTGWLGYLNSKGLLFVKKFKDLKKSEPAPAEAEIQVYANMGKTFIEVEEQGAYVTVEPKGSVTYTTRWYLTRTDMEAIPSRSLFKKAKKIAKKLA